MTAAAVNRDWMADLTVVMVTCFSRHALEENLDTLDYDLRERLLIVDNASGDGTAEFVGSRRMAVIRSPRNAGFGAAANIGAQAACTPYLCFLNPDCRPTRNLFQAGVKAIAGRPDTIACPRLDEGPAGTSRGVQAGYAACGLVLDTICTNYGGQGSRLYRWCKERRQFFDPSWHWAHGACLFLHRATFLDLGGFDETFFLYMEDVDFGRRISARGCRIVEIPVTLQHQGGGSTQSSLDSRRRFLNRSRSMYAARNHSPYLGRILDVLAAPQELIRRVRRGSR